jgi:hypothetical protein
VAQDTVQVLVHLNATSDIYSRQQNAFNYFLLSAFAVISLAICHAPNIFAGTCTQSFIDAIGLVRGFSRHSIASHRLWKSIRGLLPRLKSLGLQDCHDRNQNQNLALPRHSPTAPPHLANMNGQEQPHTGHQPSVSRSDDDAWFNNRHALNGPLGNQFSTGEPADMAGLNSDILNLFDTLGQGSQFEADFDAGTVYHALEVDLANTDGLDISRRFLQGLM